MKMTDEIDITTAVRQHLPFLGRKGRVVWDVEEGKVTIAGMAKGRKNDWLGWCASFGDNWEGGALFLVVEVGLLDRGLQHPEVGFPKKIEVFYPGSRSSSTRYSMGYRGRIYTSGCYYPQIAEQEKQEKKCRKLRVQRSTKNT